LPSEPDTMLDRARRRASAAADDFAACRRVEIHTEGPEWTIGERPPTDERPGAVLLALADAKPVELTGEEADELAKALALRAASLRGEQPLGGRVD
jgi:hypothetical protein